MKSEIPAPIISMELPAPVMSKSEQGISVQNSPEVNSNNIEKFEKKSEISAASSDVGITTAMPVAASTVVDNTSVVSTTSDDGTPTVAADADLIEKEWVDKAKKIVAQTKDNPHKREEDVAKLSRSYLKERFNKEIKSLSD